MSDYPTYESWQGGGGQSSRTATQPYSGETETQYPPAQSAATERGGATQMCQAAARAAGDMVGRHPASSALLVTAAGFAVGAVLGACLARPAKQQSAMARFGQSVWDSMAKVMPDSWTK
jgi:hypothetical protein